MQDENSALGAGLRAQLQDVAAREQAAREDAVRLRSALQSAERARDDAAQRAVAAEAAMRASEDKLVRKRPLSGLSEWCRSS